MAMNLLRGSLYKYMHFKKVNPQNHSPDLISTVYRSCSVGCWEIHLCTLTHTHARTLLVWGKRRKTDGL